MERRVPLSLAIGLVLWVLSVALVSIQAWLDAEVGGLGLLVGLIAFAITAPHCYGARARPTPRR